MTYGRDSEGREAKPEKFRVRGRVYQVVTEGFWENLEARSTLI